MSKIANRIFNDSLSIDPNVKKRLEEIQDLSGGIFDSVNATTAELNKDKHTFGGSGYLSSKIPFARMWTAVRVTKETEPATPISVDENISNYPFDFENNAYEFPQVVEPSDYDGSEILEKPLEKYPSDSFKVYQLGMNPSAERDIFSPQQDDTETTTLGKTILPSQKNNYTDTSYQGDRKSLRGPAGITSINSSTQNSLGPVAGILTTTVNFSVPDFEEFDLIYSKYFLRPGAKVFVDFGYTDDKSFKLYNPDEYITDPETFNEKVYGKIEYDEDGNQKILSGQMQDSKYGMVFIQGQVVKFNATLDPTSGIYKCSVTISSKATQLVDVNIEDDIIGNIKKNILSNIEFRILELAEDALFPNNKKLLNPAGLSDEEAKEWSETADIFAAEMLGGKTNNIPELVNTQLGIYWKGIYTKGKTEDADPVPKTGDDAIYLSYGFIEDVLINGELGKYRKASEQFNDTEDAIEFDSSQSYTTWSADLYNRQLFLKQNKQLPFLFPEEWNDTYNTRKKKTPGNYVTDTLVTESDKDRKRIPIREVFIKLSIFKQAVKSAESVSEIFNYIFKQMAQSTGYMWDWGLNATDETNTRLGIVDKNYNVKDIVNNDSIKEQINDEDFFNNMFMFEPFSPQTIVKSINLNLSPGDGSAISSKLALQGLGAAGRNVFATSEIIDEVQAQMAIEDLQDDGTYKSIYNVEYYPPSEGGSDLEKLFASFESDDNLAISDPTLLSAENIYGGNFSNFANVEINSEAYIGKASKILQDKEGLSGTTDASSKPSIEFKKVKAKLENSNYEFCDNAYDYFTKQHLVFSQKTKPTILPMKLNMSIHGFTGLQPSDKFRLNHIPTRYRNFVFFQIMRISHDLSPGGFTTNLDCVMRIRDDVKSQLPVNNTKVNVMSPFFLNTGHKLTEVKKILPFLSYIRPNLEVMTYINADSRWSSGIFAGVEEYQYVYTARTLPVVDGAGITQPMSQIDSTFTIEDGKDPSDTASKEFIARLEALLYEFPNLRFDVNKEGDESQILTFITQYQFKKDTDYLIFINNKKFVILEKAYFQTNTNYMINLLGQYSTLINGQYEQEEVEES